MSRRRIDSRTVLRGPAELQASLVNKLCFIVNLYRDVTFLEKCQHKLLLLWFMKCFTRLYSRDVHTVLALNS